jgi:hypothetical protein
MFHHHQTPPTTMMAHTIHVIIFVEVDIGEVISILFILTALTFLQDDDLYLFGYYGIGERFGLD